MEDPYCMLVFAPTGRQFVHFFWCDFRTAPERLPTVEQPTQQPPPTYPDRFAGLFAAFSCNGFQSIPAGLPGGLWRLRATVPDKSRPVFRDVRGVRRTPHNPHHTTHTKQPTPHNPHHTAHTLWHLAPPVWVDFQNFVGFGRALLSRQSVAVFRVPRIETLQALTYYPMLMGERAPGVFEFTGVRQNYCEKWQPRTPLNQLPIRVARVLYSLE